MKLKVILFIGGAICLLGILGTGLYFLPVGAESYSASEIGAKPMEVSEQNFELKAFNHIEGTKFLMADVVVQELSTNSTSRITYIPSEVINIIFLDSESIVSTQLFDTNEMVIHDTMKYPNLYDWQPSQPSARVGFREDAEVVQWIVYEVIKEDTNGDKVLDEDDLITIAMSDTNGQNYFEFLHDIKTINSMNMVNLGQLIVSYNQDSDWKTSLLDLPNQTILDTKILVNSDSYN